ncbi:hypothetical protein C482_09547 [Natrialba chahannaoensis JCM 10990]|uniref:Uncharacterized protein n=1 Tax=Natrialba chahannaoensis JCM 10990 TaxID=1227492 RepID=M0AMD7_9EURY|nr:hypothetical protein C482_09547 [Natrialba chahannaoensis JCM 10990]
MGVLSGFVSGAPGVCRRSGFRFEFGSVVSGFRSISVGPVSFVPETRIRPRSRRSEIGLDLDKQR